MVDKTIFTLYTMKSKNDLQAKNMLMCCEGGMENVEWQNVNVIILLSLQYAYNKAMQKEAMEPSKPKEPQPMPTEWCLE